MFITGVISFFIWCYLVLARGGFWRADQRLPGYPMPKAWPKIAIVIPARNEAASISAVISAHLASDYPGELEIFLVDDSSSDGTADIARAAAEGGHRKVMLVSAPPLEAEWSGKLWAVNAGLAAVARKAPDAAYCLLSDADIQHGPSLARNLVAHAETSGDALVSIMARLDDRGFWGSLLIPAFIFFFQKLYPFSLVNRPRSQVAGAAGGVMLVRRDVLDDIGGVASIKGALIDDCALAARIKNGPPRRTISLFLADANADAISLRDNRSFASIQNMVTRTAFTQLDYSTMQLAGTLVGMALVYLVGPALALTWPLHRSATLAGVGLASWALMVVAYVPTLRLYGQPVWRALALPLAAVFYAGFTVISAWQHWRGRGGHWKGRTYGDAGKPGINS